MKGGIEMKITVEQADLTEPEIIIRGDTSSEQMQNILGLLNSSQSSQKMFFFKGEREYLFDLKSVIYFEAQKNKISAHIGNEIYETKSRLYELEKSLYTKGFVRINKSVLVNADYISAVETEFSGNYTAYMKNGGQLVISRKYMKDFRKYILEVF